MNDRRIGPWIDRRAVRDEQRAGPRSPAAGSSRSAASAWAPSPSARCWATARRAAAPRRRPTRWRPKAPHFAPKAKRVIFLFQAGAPSHLDLFDDKPQLRKFDGTLPPAELLKGYRAAFINPNSTLLGPQVQVRQARPVAAPSSRSCCRTWREVVDDVAIVKSMVTDAFNHAPAQIFMNTGSQQFGRPSLGSWATYGLGTECQDLPAFVVFSTGQKGTSGGAAN